AVTHIDSERAWRPCIMHPLEARAGNIHSMTDDFSFTYAGVRTDISKFGRRYMTDFRRILETYVAANTRNILEWGSGLTTQMLAAFAETLPCVELLLTIDEKADYQQAIFAARVRPAFLKEVALGLRGPSRGRADPELAYATYPLGLGKR